ncbi:MAG: NAD+ synthase [Planctomycetota bacterium]|nr:NAD+ synthase [Planctomycetota bacterium]
MRVAVAQINTTAGDVAGNTDLVREAWRRAAEDGADLFVAPELVVVGYPPRDLLLREGVIRAAEAATAALAAEMADGPPGVIGTIARNPAPTGRGLLNIAAVLRDGRVEATYAKRLLPTYDVFDEQRYFAPGNDSLVVDLGPGRRLGVLVCEDLWSADLVRGRRLYEADPPADLLAAGVDVVVAISASPYHGGKDAHRRDLFAAEARRMGVPLIAVNQVGGNDDVLFDGRSRVFDGEGRILARLASFESDYAVVDLADAAPRDPKPGPKTPPEVAREVRRALVMGIRDYCGKTGFRRALIGLSGGVDSAVTACLAADALGAENVMGVGMPGPYTSNASREDALALAKNLGTQFIEVDINAMVDAALAALVPHFEGKPADVTEENLQSRMRGTSLMALSNKHGHLVLSTGNKSEVAVGYCTLYGDTNGGLAVLSDVWKTMVYEIARLYEAEGLIPSRTIERPPSAELAPDQTDQDSLPPYDVLDRILHQRVEKGLGLREIVAMGEDEALVTRILRMVEKNEYKRRQLPPGLKVSPTAFGVGWRMPIASPIDLSGEI